MELTIEKLVYGGEGLGRSPEGEVLFVPWSAPGDRLQVSRQPGATKPPRAQVETILQASTERTQPPCSVFGTCGGCQWQHITPIAQRSWKREIVLESLQRIGKLSQVEVLETLGSDDTAWHYRNRVQWEINPQGQLGYYAAQSHEMVEFDHCWIIPDALNEIAMKIRQLIQQDSALASGLQRIEAFINQQQQVSLLFEGTHQAACDQLAQVIQVASPNIVGISYRDGKQKFAQPVLLWGQGFLIENLGGQEFQISTGSFFQTNPQAAEQMLAVLDQWMLPNVESLLDIYAGVGVFAIHFKEKAKRILAIESAKTTMADAQENTKRNQAQHVELKTGDAQAILRNLKEKFDVAILDPPRAGCQPEVLEWLSKSVQKQLLYVSCNPTTLARDLKTLTAQGWRLQAVQPVDMFPQTYHIECIANLTR